MQNNLVQGVGSSSINVIGCLGLHTVLDILTFHFLEAKLSFLNQSEKYFQPVISC